MRVAIAAENVLNICYENDMSSTVSLTALFYALVVSFFAVLDLNFTLIINV